MIKGCRKRMVIVSGINDSSIEAAYFVMKECPDFDAAGDEDILKKANSIIENSLSDTVSFSHQKKDKKKCFSGISVLISFLAGFISGAVIIGFFELVR